MSSLDRILPFLRPIEDLLVDPTVTEVMVNDGGRRLGYLVLRNEASEPEGTYVPKLRLIAKAGAANIKHDHYQRAIEDEGGVVPA